MGRATVKYEIIENALIFKQFAYLRQFMRAIRNKQRVLHWFLG